MDTEYIISSMTELGGLTSRDAVMALHHPDVYPTLRYYVDNNLMVPPDLVQNLCDDAYNRESTSGQDYWNLQAIGDFMHTSRAIAERLACEISKRLVRAHKMAKTTNNVIFSVIDSVTSEDNIYDIMTRSEQAVVSRHIAHYNQIVSSHSSTFCTSTATNRVVVPVSGSFGTLTNCIYSTYNSMIGESIQNFGPSKFIKPSIQKRTKSAIKRALKLITGLGFGDEIKVFLSGTSIEVSHPESDFKFVMTKYANSIIRSTEHPSYSTPFSLELYTKSDVFLSKLCVYLQDTPILDQVLALTMFVKSGCEDEILETANFFSRTQDESIIEEVLSRNPQLSKKLAIRKSTGQGNIIRTFVDTEFEERHQVSTAIMPQIRNIITSSGIPTSVNLQYI